MHIRAILFTLVFLASVVSATAQEGPVRLRANAFLTQNYCINRGELSGLGERYYFRPQLGAIGELVFEYHLDSSRLYVATGLGLWFWGYKIGLNEEATGPALYGWRAGQNGAAITIPFRVGYYIARNVDIAAGVLLVKYSDGGSASGSGFVSGSNGVEVQGQSIAHGRSYTSLAFDLSLNVAVSRRFNVSLRGALDTKAYSGIQMQHQVTSGGVTQSYSFSGNPKLAFFGVGAGYRIF
jgi:hypothetical protein